MTLGIEGEGSAGSSLFLTIFNPVGAADVRAVTSSLRKKTKAIIKTIATPKTRPNFASFDMQTIRLRINNARAKL